MANIIETICPACLEEKPHIFWFCGACSDKATGVSDQTFDELIDKYYAIEAPFWTLINPLPILIKLNLLQKKV